MLSAAPAAAARQFPVLRADGRVLDNSPRRMGWLVPSDPLEDFDSLTVAFRRDGYLFLKGFLRREAVLDLRARAFAHLGQAGLIRPGSDPRLGLAADTPAPAGEVNRRLMEFVRSAAFESFCMSPRLWQFMDRFVGGLSYLHKRKLLRHTLPFVPGTTPAHYDLIYLRGGTDRLVTAWIPIGDVPVEMGGLVYLEGSHQSGVEMEAEFSLKNAALPPEERISAYNKNMTEGGWVSKDLPAMAEKFDTRWLVADYEAGDVVLHSPFMIHAATLNESRNGVIRLSTDIRYQNVTDEIDARWNNHWTLDDML
ncbi:MAG TPA: phytanoyl-CoA dioxygenase family protein [Devosia sp.]|nr:phytanoyl-CoA dioxygenase family protein [Devosia sp.]